MFESGFEERITSALHAFEVDGARFHTPSVDEVLALGVSAPLTAELIGQLFALDPDRLDEDQAISYTVAMQRLADAASGRVAIGVTRVVACTTDQPSVPRELQAAAQLGSALGLGAGGADRLVAEAPQIINSLPATREMLLAGNLSWRKASSIASATLGMTAESAWRVEDKVLPKAGQRSPAQHDAAVRRAVDQVDPEHADRKRKQRERDIRLVKHHYGAGMGELFATMPSEELELFWTAADAHARRLKAAGDPRTLDQLRVAFLGHVARSYLTHGDPAYCDRVCDPRPPDPATAEPLPPEPQLPASFTNDPDGEGDDDDGGGDDPTVTADRSVATMLPTWVPCRPVTRTASPQLTSPSPISPRASLRCRHHRPGTAGRLSCTSPGI